MEFTFFCLEILNSMPFSAIRSVIHCYFRLLQAYQFIILFLQAYFRALFGFFMTIPKPLWEGRFSLMNFGHFIPTNSTLNWGCNSQDKGPFNFSFDKKVCDIHKGFRTPRILEPRNGVT